MNHILKILRWEVIRMRIIEEILVAQGIKVGIVVGRFNEFIVSKLWRCSWMV